MRIPYIFAVLLLGLASHLFGQQPTSSSTDSLQTAKQWQVRSPLTSEQQVQREKERAELEEMKRRFRAYTEEAKTEDGQRNPTENDYLWANGQQGGATNQETNDAANNTEKENTEELRLEISRQLLYGKSPQTAPDAPVQPTYTVEDIPASYDQKSSTDWEADIEAAFQAKGIAPSSTDLPAIKTIPTQVETLTNGQQFRLQQLRFEPLAPEQIVGSSTEELQRWATLLKQHPQMIVEIRSHVSSVTDELAAIDLSVQRAKNIVAWFQTQGIAATQLRQSGWGNSSPLIPNTSAEAAEKNERIELVVLEIPGR